MPASAVPLNVLRSPDRDLCRRTPATLPNHARGGDEPAAVLPGTAPHTSRVGLLRARRTLALGFGYDASGAAAALEEAVRLAATSSSAWRPPPEVGRAGRARHLRPADIARFFEARFAPRST